MAGDAGVTGYEDLRGHVLGLGHSSGTPAGLLVLLGQGVAAWMAHCSLSPAPLSAIAASPTVDRRHAALVRVLASMALAVAKEVRT